MLTAPTYNACYPFFYNYALKLFLDTLSQPEATLQNIMFPICIFLTNELALPIFWRASNIAERKSEPFVRKSIILDSYNYVQHHSYEFFQNNFTGSIASKLKGIRDGYDTFWAEMHHGLLSKLLSALISLTTIVFVYRNIALFLFCWAIAYSIIVYRLSRKLHRLSYEDSNNNHTIIGRVSDKLSNITSLLYYTARKREYKNLETFLDDTFVPKQEELYRYDFFMRIVEDILYVSMFVTMLCYLLYLKLNNIISIGDFAFIFSMTLVISEKIWHFTNDLQSFYRQMGDLQSAFSILQENQKGINPPQAKPLKYNAPSIEFKNLSFEYEKESAVLNNISLHIKPGEKIGLVGESGAGKSTIVKLLLKFFSPNSGDILVSEQNIKNVTQESVRSHIAVIPQDTMLFHRSIIENIRYGKPDATQEEIIEASKKAHVHDFIMSLPQQYETTVGERGIKLSGGQKQRISIARAILKNAPILILDEATSSLDSKTESLIQDSLNFFIEDSEKTVIAIAHRLSTLKHMDRIIVLDKGTIIEEGTHEQLLHKENSLYKELWNYQKI